MKSIWTSDCTCLYEVSSSQLRHCYWFTILEVDLGWGWKAISSSCGWGRWCWCLGSWAGVGAGVVGAGVVGAGVVGSGRGWGSWCWCGGSWGGWFWGCWFWCGWSCCGWCWSGEIYSGFIAMAAVPKKVAIAEGCTGIWTFVKATVVCFLLITAARIGIWLGIWMNLTLTLFMCLQWNSLTNTIQTQFIVRFK